MSTIVEPPFYIPSQPSSRSPVFDFDSEWAQHIAALRTTEKASSLALESGFPSTTENMEVEPAPQQMMMAWAPVTSESNQPAPLQTISLSPAYYDLAWGGCTYESDYSISPQDASSSSTYQSCSSFYSDSSPSLSRGSKRLSADALTSPSPDFATSKRRRLADGSSKGLFYLDDSEEDPSGGLDGPWEIVQGAWELPSTAPQNAPVVSVREMPALREPAPRLPSQVMEALILFS